MISERLEHPSNELSPIDSRESGRLISERLEQPLNALTPID
jgi:hypothetical protein